MSQQIIFRAKCIFLKWTETIFHFISFLLLPFIFLYLLLLHNYFLPSLFLFCLSPPTSPTLFYFSSLLLSYPLPPSPLHYKFSSPWLFSFLPPNCRNPNPKLRTRDLPRDWNLRVGRMMWCEAGFSGLNFTTKYEGTLFPPLTVFAVFFLQLLHHLYLLLTWYTEVAGSCTKLSMWPNCRTASYVCLALN